MSELNPYASPSEEPPQQRAAPHLSPPQTVKYQLIEEDHVAATEYAAMNSPEIVKMQSKNRRGLYLIGGSLVILGLLATPVTEIGVIPLGAGVFLVILAAASKWLNKRGVRSRVKAWIKQGIVPLSDDVYTLTIDFNGIDVSEPLIRSVIAWPKITRVRSTEDHLFLFWQPHSPITIPAKAFVSEEGFQSFCRLAERLWDERREPESPTG